MVEGHWPLSFTTANGAFLVGVHHDASLRYPAGHEPTFGSGIAVAANRIVIIAPNIARIVQHL
jgi:hypothetical protein